MILFPKQFLQQHCQPRSIEGMIGNRYHGFIEQKSVSRSVHTIQFKEGQRGSHRRALVAIQKRLRLCDMKSIRRSHAKQIGMAIPKVVLRLHDGGFKSNPVTNSVSATVFCERILLEKQDFVDGQKQGLIHPGSSLCEFSQEFLVVGKHLLYNLFKTRTHTSMHSSSLRGFDPASAQSSFDQTNLFVRKVRNLFDKLSGAHPCPFARLLQFFNPTFP